MRTAVLIRLLTATLAAIACDGAHAPTASVPADPPPHPPNGTLQPRLEVIAYPANRRVLAGESFLVRAYAYAGSSELPDSILTWQSTDPSVARIESNTGSLFQIRTLRAGLASLTATSGAVSASVNVEALPIHVGATSLTVDSFRVVQFGSGPNWVYAPTLALRDTANQNSRLVEFSYDVPGIGQLQPCYGDQSLGLVAWLPVPGDYGDFWLVGIPPASRTSDDAVAHLTVRLADGSGARLDAHGPVVLGLPPMEFTSGGMTCQYP